MARIFLALSLEKGLNDQIIEFKKKLKANLLKDTNISWQKNDHHHLTVYFVGEMEPEQIMQMNEDLTEYNFCLLYTSPSPRDATLSRMPSSA